MGQRSSADSHPGIPGILFLHTNEESGESRESEEEEGPMPLCTTGLYLSTMEGTREYHQSNCGFLLRGKRKTTKKEVRRLELQPCHSCMLSDVL